MASGFAKDPVYGLPRTGALVTQTQTLPRRQTVLNMARKTVETIQIQSGDNHYIKDNTAAGYQDLYHE